MKRGIKLFSILALAFLVSCGDEAVKQSSVRNVKCETISGVASSVSTVFYTAKLIPAVSANVSFRLSGTVESVLVNEGQLVKKGSVLALMDKRDYELQLAATEAEHSALSGEVARVVELYEAESVTVNDYEKAVNGLKRMEAKLALHRNALADTRLVAPFDAYVDKVIYNGGETVAAGMPVVKLISNELPEVEINISVDDYLRASELQSASVRVDKLGAKSYELKPKSLTKKANLNQLYTQVFTLGEEAKSEGLTAGMTASVTLNFTTEGGNSVVIPFSAVVNEGGSTFVWLMLNGEATKREVELLNINSKGEAFVVGNIAQGDTLITAGLRTLREGQKVKALAIKSETNIGGVL